MFIYNIIIIYGVPGTGKPRNTHCNLRAHHFILKNTILTWQSDPGLLSSGMYRAEFNILSLHNELSIYIAVCNAHSQLIYFHMYVQKSQIREI